jgi:hypothetical protein
MDKLTSEVNEKIILLNERYNNINNLFKGDFKKKLIFYDKINSKLDDIEGIIDNFELNNEDEINVDLEIENRIKENKDFKELISNIAPYIILYQLNKLNNI